MTIYRSKLLAKLRSKHWLPCEGDLDGRFYHLYSYEGVYLSALEVLILENIEFLTD